MNYNIVSIISLVATILGGAIGAYWASAKRPNQKILMTVTEVLIGVIAANGVVDKYVGYSSIQFSAFIGVSIGAASGLIMDTVYELLPNIIRKSITVLVNFMPTVMGSWLRTVADKLDEKSSTKDL